MLIVHTWMRYLGVFILRGDRAHIASTYVSALCLQTHYLYLALFDLHVKLMKIYMNCVWCLALFRTSADILPPCRLMITKNFNRKKTARRLLFHESELDRRLLLFFVLLFDSMREEKTCLSLVWNCNSFQVRTRLREPEVEMMDPPDDVARLKCVWTVAIESVQRIYSKKIQPDKRSKQRTMKYTDIHTGGVHLVH